MIVGWVVGPLRGFNVHTPSSFPALVRPYKKPRLYTNPRHPFPDQDDPPHPVMLEHPVELRPVGSVISRWIGMHFLAEGHSKRIKRPFQGASRSWREEFRSGAGVVRP